MLLLHNPLPDTNVLQRPNPFHARSSDALTNTTRNSHPAISSNKIIRTHLRNGNLSTARHVFENIIVVLVESTRTWNLAEFAAQKLLDLNPFRAVASVQLANVYATMSRWDGVARVRQSIKENKVVKMFGYSWIEVQNEIHEFGSGDRTHPQLTSINEKMNELEKRMKAAGYVPDLDCALHDLEEERKELILSRHNSFWANQYLVGDSNLGVEVE